MKIQSIEVMEIKSVKIIDGKTKVYERKSADDWAVWQSEILLMCSEKESKELENLYQQKVGE